MAESFPWGEDLFNIVVKLTRHTPLGNPGSGGEAHTLEPARSGFWVQIPALLLSSSTTLG